MTKLQQVKNFRIFHWDTFDNETLLVSETDTLSEAQVIIKEKYKISDSGADQVDIVDRHGNIVEKFKIC